MEQLFSHYFFYVSVTHSLYIYLVAMETVISEVAQTTGIELKLEQEKVIREFIQGNRRGHFHCTKKKNS